MITKIYDSISDFAKDAREIRYFHVYHNTPDMNMVGDLLKYLGVSESIVGIKVSDSQGLLSELQMPCSAPYIGAFCEGAFVDYADRIADIPKMMANARRFFGHDNL